MTCRAAAPSVAQVALADLSIPVDEAALCLNCFSVFAKGRPVCPRCESAAWISLNFYVPPSSRRGLST
jgi:hypothetical protein